MSANKFRLWDSKALVTSYQNVIQIKDMIESLIAENQGPESLPDAVVPIDVLYDISACFVGMYEKLLEKELVVSSTDKLINSKIH